MQNNRLSKNNKGVTLVEVIAVIAVLGVVMAAVTGFMITGAKMSAKVSGDAKLGIREQTAVEYINERLLENTGEISVDDQDKISVDGHEYYAGIQIGGINLYTDLGDPEDPAPLEECKVKYNNVELCEGYIYFEKTGDDGTVIYVLNGTRHVVHLRVGS